jgi:hypothetical protein
VSSRSAAIIADGPVALVSQKNGKKKLSDLTKANQTLKAFKDDPVKRDLLINTKPLFHIMTLDDPWGQDSRNKGFEYIAGNALKLMAEELGFEESNAEYKFSDDMLKTVCGFCIFGKACCD